MSAAEVTILDVTKLIDSLSIARDSLGELRAGFDELVAQNKALRRQVADRDGRIATLQSQLSWRAGL